MNYSAFHPVTFFIPIIVIGAIKWAYLHKMLEMHAGLHKKIVKYEPNVLLLN
jgi:hypothetical protein